MITIQQDYEIRELHNLLLRYGNTKINLNKRAIQEDIDRLNDEIQEIKTSNSINKKLNKKNISNIIDYLKVLSRKSDENMVEITWTVHNNIIKSSPIEMINIPEYNVFSTDYINLDSEIMIHLDYTELSDIIAFEMMHRDLGETHETMEEKLKDVGIIAINDSSVITKHFTDNSIFELSKSLLISDSPYIVHGRNRIVDYFGRSEFKLNRYKDVVSHSCKSVMALIVEYILNKCVSNGVKFKLCNISDTGIYIIVNSYKELENQLYENIYIRTFGRKLEVVPKIQIF